MQVERKPLRYLRESYYHELGRAMRVLASDARTLFVGQGVGVAGTTMSGTFDGVADEKRLEFPVAEDLQTGYCTGLSLTGAIPICVFPRWDFMMCGMSQIVLHLDRLPLYSDYRPKVIIRVATPSIGPFYPGPQHDDDFSAAFRLMLRTVDIVLLEKAEDIVPAYQRALEAGRSTILCEYTDLYREALGG